MKNKFFFATMILSILISSCIKDEGADREADIEKIFLPADVMMTSIINEDLKKVLLMVYDTTGFHSKKIAPTIVTSPGATVFPNSEDSVILSNYMTEYVVTAGSGEVKKYTIEVVPYIPLKFGFEDWYTVSNIAGTKVYDMLSETLWTNANEGVNLLYPPNKEFPTRKTKESYSGEYAAFLETVEGQRSSFPVSDIPIYAGSLFQGAFKANLGDPVSSAKFGQIHPEYAGKPIRFTGWYKYSSGAMYQQFRIPEGGKKKDVILVPGQKDEFDIYAVLFEVTKGSVGQTQYLNAADLTDLENSKYPIVAIASVADHSEKAIYTKFDIPFTYRRPINYEENDYKLAIVLSSSKDGAFYEGAIGSKLWVDEIEVECVPIEGKSQVKK